MTGKAYCNEISNFLLNMFTSQTTKTYYWKCRQKVTHFMEKIIQKGFQC